MTISPKSIIYNPFSQLFTALPSNLINKSILAIFSILSKPILETWPFKLSWDTEFHVTTIEIELPGGK
ncbi:MAG: hypothetical protein ACI9WT_000966 [Flavobacterium sp.]|jgi:hypothetical protein